MSSKTEYSLYLVRRDDGHLYTGIATDVQRRIADHENGRRGSKYLRGRQPLELYYQRAIGTRSLASKIECRIKKLSKTEKENLDQLASHIDDLIVEFGAAAQ